jgi:hypothetical protein
MLVTNSEGGFERNLSFADASKTGNCHPLTVSFKFFGSECGKNLSEVLFSADKFAVLAKWNRKVHYPLG